MSIRLALVSGARPVCVALSLLLPEAAVAATAPGAAPTTSAAPPMPDATASLPVPEPSEHSSIAPDDPALALSRAHFESGLAAYQTGNYALAITQWTQAHAVMASVPALTGPRHVLGLDLGQAHLRAYDRDGDPRHLEVAQPLLRGYIEWVDRTDHELTDVEREDRPRALDMLARIDAEQRGLAPVPAITRPAASPVGSPASPSRMDAKTSRRLVIAGSVTLGVAVLSAVTALALMPSAGRIEYEYEQLQAEALERYPNYPADGAAEYASRFDEINRRGHATNAAIIAMGSISVITLVTGVPLLATGLVARKRNLSMSPNLSRNYAGAQLGFRF
ncbi:MAG: hypothetical protein IAG13_26195 [Deltaproteobacteria bacterium]|nr:hypothetical protein [Nannocystaceae bacterium]